MADKSNILKTFNNQFFAFLDDIRRVFPDNVDIATGKKSFEMLRLANASLIIKSWYSYVYSQYKESIDNGDVDYFVNKDYQSDLQTVANNGEVMRIIDSLRDPIKNMDEANKAHTVKYLQILSKLSEAYMLKTK
jgi:hypothetical protein